VYCNTVFSGKKSSDLVDRKLKAVLRVKSDD